MPEDNKLKNEEIIMEPRCMPASAPDDYEHRMQAAVTNRGHLIPCCWLDQPEVLRGSTMKKLLEVSKISEHNTIEDILLHPRWRKFAKNLAQRNISKILPACIDHCRKRRGRFKIKKETYLDYDETKEKETNS